MENRLVLVTGVTGYIGGRLVPQLIEAGYRVRVLVRDRNRLQGRTWVNQVDVVGGDVLDSASLLTLMSDVSAAYYLIHSMSSSVDFVQRDLQAARNFGEAARANGVNQIIYLGGLGDPQTDLSKHLRSRQQTGQALAESGVPVTEFRAAIVVGSGSISFEMIRYLTERVPIMICPKWVFTRVQPIAINDVLAYLVTALITPHAQARLLRLVEVRFYLWRYAVWVCTSTRPAPLVSTRPCINPTTFVLLGASGHAYSSEYCPPTH